MSGLSAHDRDEWRSSVAAVTARCAPDGPWDALFGLGVLQTCDPHTGLGGLTDLAVAVEECGAVAVGTPLLSQALGVRGLSSAPPSPNRERLLADGVHGRERIALALPRDWTRPTTDVSATASGPQWTLEGVGGLVLDGHRADVVLVPADTAEGPGIFAVRADAPGVSRCTLAALDPTRSLTEVRFAGSPATVLGLDGDWAAQRLWSEVAALLAADSLGGARAVLRGAVEYARQRIQFGRAIGSFQAVKHRLADLSIELDGAVAAVEYALRQLDDGTSDAALAASIAKLTATDAYLTIAAGAIQTYGGIGFTWEHPAHIYLKRAHTNGQLGGSASLHLGLVADHLGI